MESICSYHMCLRIAYFETLKLKKAGLFELVTICCGYASLYFVSSHVSERRYGKGLEVGLKQFNDFLFFMKQGIKRHITIVGMLLRAMLVKRFCGKVGAKATYLVGKRPVEFWNRKMVDYSNLKVFKFLSFLFLE